MREEEAEEEEDDDEVMLSSTCVTVQAGVCQDLEYPCCEAPQGAGATATEQESKGKTG